MTKLAGILACGTFYSPWTPFCIASIYDVVDELVIVNGGYDMGSPDINEYNVPLEQVTKDIEVLDVDSKIVEVRDFSIDDLGHTFEVSTQRRADREGLEEWFDVRGLNITLANELAVAMGATDILKIDSDQVCYSDVTASNPDIVVGGEHPFNLKQESNGCIFHQTEFVGDCGVGLQNYLFLPKPSNAYNDSVFTYRASASDYYLGGGGPMVGPRENTNSYHCAHLRHANPAWLSREEKLEHFYGRFWFRYLTNDGLWGDELESAARRSAIEMIAHPNKEVSDIQLPNVISRNNIKEYRGRKNG